VVIFISGCRKDETPDDPMSTDLPNILLIITDDMGKDAIAGYVEGDIKAVTPNIDGIRNAGLTFQNFWVNPTCSPTRSAIISGKYGYRTGVKWANDELDASERILHRLLQEETNDAYATATVGKWHLSGDNGSNNPETFGMDYYAGLIRGAVQDYYQWQLTEDGAGSLSTGYVTEVFTDLAIHWVSDQSKPWFLWLAHNAPHTPFHAPPVEMHNQGNLPEYTNGLDPIPYYVAAVEAIDFQIGRLLNGIPQDQLDQTIIIFMGDNGTPNQVAQDPFANNKSKGTLHQGGINVPLFISGKGVSRTGTENSLITNTDLYSTIADLAETGITEVHDSKSFKSLLSTTGTHRSFQYTEMDNGTDDQWAISNGSYKLIVNANGNEEFYHLDTDPYERTDLLLSNLSTEAVEAKQALEAELVNIRD